MYLCLNCIMSIIANIRRFLRLDKKRLELENEFVYSVGLYMEEWKEYEKWDGMESGCFGLHLFHFPPIHFSHC